MARWQALLRDRKRAALVDGRPPRGDAALFQAAGRAVQRFRQRARHARPCDLRSHDGLLLGRPLAADENRRELREIYHLCSGKYECLGASMSAVTPVGGQGFLEIDGSLWQSDGTPRGTKPHDVLGKADPGTFLAIGDRLVLGATSHQGEQQLWETDGTSRGTRALSDGDLDRPFWVQGQPMPFAGALYMAADQ